MALRSVPKTASFEAALADTALFVEQSLEALLPQPAGPEARLLEAMRYATLGGGKRLRGFLVVQSGGLFGVDMRALGRVAAAVECLHAYSLVHDDLPAMDDDDLRRGKPTVHKAFDEATAILAGDALLTHAFGLISSPEAHGDPFVRCELVSRLALAAGSGGMVGGQMMDIAFEGKDIELPQITRLQRMKTAALIAFSCEAGAIMGKAAPPMRAALFNYGQDLGLAFQIADDLLDAEGNAVQMGKAAQKDAELGKSTVVSVMGAERAHAQAEAMAGQAVHYLDLFDEKADLLRAAAQFVLQRKSLSADKFMTWPSNMTLLDRVRVPADLRALSKKDLPQLADELRKETIDAVSMTGGHLGAGLGVVELTVALHYVFNTPDDKIIWDVGHQAYPHKILTGRRDRIRTLRMAGGLSGFTRRGESEYDPFGAAHSSTSISAGLGFAVARDLKHEKRNVVAVIGDGAMSAGMAYEAMNNAGAMDARLIVILNDNDMSIAPPVGAMSAYLARVVSSKPYRGFRRFWKAFFSRFPGNTEKLAKRWEEYARGFFTGGTLFEEMGFYYVGPIDGHNLDHLIPVLENARDAQQGPILIHVVTKKGKGYAPAEASADKYHGVAKFNVLTGEQSKSAANAPSYTKVFAEALVAEAEKDERIVAITAAMPGGTGLDLFAKKFPGRCFDVGIAEQHAVTFAAGLAADGMKPFAAIYSTFLQRAYDQVVHDVAIQSLPVRFAMDRAGLVGADGPTHAGSFDITYLATLPGFVVMAAADEVELTNMVATAASIDDRPSALRYPRGEGLGLERPKVGTPLAVGKGRILREGTSIAILSLGTRLQEALLASEKLSAYGLSATVADARFAKPLDEDLIRRLAREHEVLITVEEGAIGGFASHVMQFLALDGGFDKGLKMRPMTLPDRFIDQDSPERMYEAAQLDARSIVATALNALGRESEAIAARDRA